MRRHIFAKLAIYLIYFFHTQLYKNLLVSVNHLKNIALNVPVVCDGLTARIRGCVARPELANCGWNEPWEPLGDLGEWNPGAAEWRRNAYNSVICCFAVLFINRLNYFLCFLLFYLQTQYQEPS